jgi:hypothetical protein
MRWVLTLSAFILFFTVQPAAAEIVAEPICFLVINETENDVNGSFWTDLYTRPDGIQARHRSNFRLKYVRFSLFFLVKRMCKAGQLLLQTFRVKMVDMIIVQRAISNYRSMT